MYKVIFAILIIGLVQAAAVDYLAILGTKPDILLAAVIFFSLYFRKDEGIKTAIFAGIFADITSAVVFASNTFAFTVCAVFLNRYGSHFYKQKISTQVWLCAILYFMTNFLILLINYFVPKNLYAHAQFPIYLWIIFKSAIYTGCISPIIFFALSKIFKVRLAYA